MVLEMGIFVSQAVWLWRVRHVRREAKKAGKTYDEYIAEHPSKKLSRSPSSDSIEDVEAGHEKPDTTVTKLEVRTEVLAAPVQAHIVGSTEQGHASEKSTTSTRT